MDYNKLEGSLRDMGIEKYEMPISDESTKTPTVIPSVDYTFMQEKIDALTKENKAYKNELARYRKILENGEIHHVEEMVNDFQREVKKSLKDIADEVNQTDFSKRTVDSVNNLIDFLSYTSKELYSLVSISNYGSFAYSEELRECEKLKEDLLRKLGKSTFTSSISSDKSEQMAEVLREALSNITDCLEEED